jgi:hypothetical protein
MRGSLKKWAGARSHARGWVGKDGRQRGHTCAQCCELDRTGSAGRARRREGRMGGGEDEEGEVVWGALGGCGQHVAPTCLLRMSVHRACMPDLRHAEII